jgi:hypothetical protein
MAAAATPPHNQAAGWGGGKQRGGQASSAERRAQSLAPPADRSALRPRIADRGSLLPLSSSSRGERRTRGDDKQHLPHRRGSSQAIVNCAYLPAKLRHGDKCYSHFAGSLRRTTTRHRGGPAHIALARRWLRAGSRPRCQRRRRAALKRQVSRLCLCSACPDFCFSDRKVRIPAAASRPARAPPRAPKMPLALATAPT